MISLATLKRLFVPRRPAPSASPAPSRCDLGPRQLERIKAAFDADYYAAQRPAGWAPHASPLDHYLAVGWRELDLDPSAAFSTRHYLNANADVRAAGVNPFVHYVLYGQAEGRSPKPHAAPASAASKPTIGARPSARPPFSGDALVELYTRRTFDGIGAIDAFERSIIVSVRREETAHFAARTADAAGLVAGVERDITLREYQRAALRDRAGGTGEHGTGSAGEAQRR